MPARNANARQSDPVLPPLHELEAEVMEHLWKSGEAPVRAVMDALNKGTGKERAYNVYDDYGPVAQEGHPRPPSRGQD
jgi:hypothetical protein